MPGVAECRVGAKLGGWAVLLTTAEIHRPAAGPASPGSRGLRFDSDRAHR
jgi:hypothetical protein